MPSHRKWHLIIILSLTLPLVVLEMVTLGSIALFASAVSDPQAIIESKYINMLRGFLPFKHFFTVKGILIFLSSCVLLLVAMKNIGQALMSYWTTRLSSSIQGFFGDKLLYGFLEMPYHWHLTKNSSNLIIVVSQWLKFIGTNFITPFMRMIVETLIILFMLISLLILRPAISIIIIGATGIIAFLVFKIVRNKLDSVANKNKNLHQSIHFEATKALHGIKEIKIAGREAYFTHIYKKHIMQFALTQSAQLLITNAPAYLLETTGFLMISGTIAFLISGQQEVSPMMLTGTLTLLVVTAWRVLPAVTRILSGITQFRNSLPYLETIFGYLDIIDEHKHHTLPNQTHCKISFQKEIAFENVSFSYNTSDPIFSNLSLTIPKDLSIGIIGTSGSGKSTFVDLLIGCLFPNEGEISVDGQVIEGLRRNAWMHSIGYVTQEPYIIDGTLAENIAFGLAHEQINRKRVIKCCKMAAIDFLDELPEGIDSSLGESGSRLSGGQKQRVAIARSLYNDPDIIVFDEATSALDKSNEDKIIETIYRLKGERTVVIIAHRHEVLRSCDRLIWFENGKVKMYDTPEKIISKYRQDGHAFSI